MGSAIKLAINPIVGTMGLAVMAFQYFNNLIAEGSHRLDIFGATARLKFGDTVCAMRQA